MIILQNDYKRKLIGVGTKKMNYLVFLDLVVFQVKSNL